MDPSSNVFERLLINLHIIGQLCPGQKLNTQQGILQITPLCSTWTRYYYSVMRYWYGESRLRMVEHIKQVIQQTIHCLLNGADREKDQKEKWGQDALITALRKARVGIESMKQTYASDAALLAQLDVILLSIDQPLQLFESE
jgi:hypothetical protein